MMTEANTSIPSERSSAEEIAISVVLVSVSMLFATLFLGMFAYRLTTDPWPPMGIEPVPLMLPSLSTFFIALSSAFLVWCEKINTKKKEGQARPLLALSMGAGVVFALCQYLLWEQMKGLGLSPSSGIFASLIYAFTWIHLGHIAVGLIVLGYSYLYLNARPAVSLRMAAKFWHFLSVIWLMIFFGLFVF